jgi:hypothetical protein
MPKCRKPWGYAAKKIMVKGFSLGSFAVTPEQGRAALSKGVTTLFLGFDTMFIPAAVKNYLGLLGSIADHPTS